jgi:hypothetical protein
MNHSELVERASVWLANTKRCSVVITEMGSGFEIPDAIGWSGSFSALVECKTSRSDFRNDHFKSVRRMSRLGMGAKRYFLVPPKMLDFAKENLYEGWGLLVAYKNRVEIKVEAIHQEERNKGREMDLLISTIRRIAGRKEPLAGMNVKCYTIDDSQNPVATLGICPIED